MYFGLILFLSAYVNSITIFQYQWLIKICFDYWRLRKYLRLCSSLLTSSVFWVLQTVAKSLSRLLTPEPWALWEVFTEELLALCTSHWFLLHTSGTRGHIHVTPQPLAPNLHVTIYHMSHVSCHNTRYEFPGSYFYTRLTSDYLTIHTGETAYPIITNPN